MTGKSYRLKDAVRQESPQEKACKAEKEKVQCGSHHIMGLAGFDPTASGRF